MSGPRMAARCIHGPRAPVRSTNLGLVRQRRRPNKTKTRLAASFRPCIDIHKGKVKQIVGSTLREGEEKNSEGPLVTNFVSDKSPGWYSQLYQSHNLPGGHVILLDRDPATKDAALAALREWPGGMQIGGGVTSDNASSYLDAGASHVIITSYVFHEGRLDLPRLQKLVAQIGAENIVLDLSCRLKDGHYWVVTDRWQKFSTLAVDSASLEELSEYCNEFLVHGVDVEGKRCGVDVDLIRILGDASPLPVTYAGGVQDLDSLEVVSVAGQDRVDVTVGSALDIFGGSLSYKEVVQWHHRRKGKSDDFIRSILD